MNRKRFKHPERWLGALSAAAGLILWLTLMYINQFYPEVVTEDTWTTTAVMAGLKLVGIVTALAGRPLLMVLIFLVSFFPAGLYLLGVPTIFRLIGVSDLLFLVSSLWIFWNKTNIRIARKPRDSL